jgi:mono/diheme cytochrome c family protein
MKLSVGLAACLLAALPQVAAAQAQLTDTQRLGQRLFEQSCGVCHTRPTLVSGLYGPALSKEAAGGREDVVRDVISNGTPRMPGFRYNFEPTQISSIVSYIKTIPPQATPAGAR